MSDIQTFLPYSSFHLTAQCLDYRRLGKQRVEVLQLLQALELESRSHWRNHPCAKMWAPYHYMLVEYGLVICTEWIKRGYRDTCYDKILNFSRPGERMITPPWLGDYKFHAAHRAALLWKMPDHYKKFNWVEEPKLDYIWPVPTS